MKNKIITDMKENLAECINNAIEKERQTFIEKEILLKTQLASFQQLYEEKFQYTIASLEKEKLSLIELHKTKIDSLETTERAHREQIATLEKSSINNEEILKTQICNLNKIIETQKEIQDVINIYGKGKDNYTKGELGENSVLKFLQSNDQYKDAIIEKTSNSTSRGDIYFAYNKLRCLIEVKNKDEITTVDLNKFEYDIKSTMQSERTINCAIFVSIRSNIYSNARRTREEFQLDTYNGIPVIYLYAKNMTEINYAIALLKKILSLETNDDENRQLLVDYFDSYYNVTKASVDYYKQCITTKNTELRKLQKLLEVALTTLDKISYDKLKISPELLQTDIETETGNSSESDEYQQIINMDSKTLNNLIKSTFIALSEKKTKTKDEINMSSVLKAIKIDTFNQVQFNKLIEEAKEEYATNYLNERIINNVVTEMNNNFNNIIPRADLKKYIPESIIRLIQKVINAGHIHQYICELCYNIKNREEIQAEKEKNELLKKISEETIIQEKLTDPMDKLTNKHMSASVYTNKPTNTNMPTNKPIDKLTKKTN